MNYIVKLADIAEHQARLGEKELLMLAIAERLEAICSALRSMDNGIVAIEEQIGGRK